MKHIQILFLVINLVIGTSVIIYINNLRRKFNLLPLRYLFLYMLSFNLLIFVDFNYKYTLYNVYESNFNSYSSILAVLLYFLVSLAEIGMIYYIYLTATSLKSSERSKVFNCSFIFLILLYGIGSVVGLTAYYLNSIEKWLYIVHMIWIISMLAIIFSILIDIYLFSRRVKEENRKIQLSSFSLIFPIGYLFFALSNLDFYFLKINFSNFDPIIFAIINISPFIWLRFFYTKNITLPMFDSTYSENFQKLITDYNISGRECDVIKLIVEGKSNKEIEDLLNISINTVKNHIYNVYQKLGINSRSQLIRFISEYRGK